ncbi:hypothetical protein HK099_003506 [Clydaea vesicula]|uniref:Uncharacterized protein n=1 Tax=Clydaea vesicula TaxID=447962 RepID=A0AAD5U7C6_9FUNG|nr:hypothetical protein HK099_003506 [Clydaea vesicula]KAJ3396768.1 hypothetical protein HDU92_001872 [Lobulomyces angularis]
MINLGIQLLLPLIIVVAFTGILAQLTLRRNIFTALSTMVGATGGIVFSLLNVRELPFLEFKNEEDKVLILLMELCKGHLFLTGSILCSLLLLNIDFLVYGEVKLEKNKVVAKTIKKN